MSARIFRRTYFGYVVVILLTATVLGILTGRRVESEAMSETREMLRHRALLVREIARPAFEGDAAPDSALAATLRRLAVETETRFTLVAADGRVLADTERDPATMVDHGDRPEILAAADSGLGLATRVSTTLRRRLMYLAIPVGAGPDGPVGFVRAALEIRSLDARLAEMRTLIAFSAILASVVGLVLGLFLVRGLTRPLVEMSRTARAIAAGDLDRRIDVQRADELGTFARAFNRMAGHVRERIVHLTDERNRLRAILGSMVEGVVAVDRDQRVLHMNGPAAGILGTDPDAAIDESFGSVSRVPEVVEALADSLNTGGEVHREIVLPAKPEDRILEVHAAPIRGGEGEWGGAVIVLHDVTEIRRLEAVRRDFVTNVSHELKTPLTVVRGIVETLLEDVEMPPETRHRFLGKASAQTSRISAIVTDLLTLSRVESGAQTMETETIDVAELVREVAAGIASAAESAGVDVATSLPATPIEIRGDRAMLRLALDNLVINGVQYTASGGHVEIRVSTDGTSMLLEVVDDGIGIEEKHRARLFERFYRVDKARSRELGGTGLGLSIVKHIARAHGGDATFESVPGEGATFRIRLPR